MAGATTMCGVKRITFLRYGEGWNCFQSRREGERHKFSSTGGILCRKKEGCHFHCSKRRGGMKGGPGKVVALKVE